MLLLISENCDPRMLDKDDSDYGNFFLEIRQHTFQSHKSNENKFSNKVLSIYFIKLVFNWGKSSSTELILFKKIHQKYLLK